ncbi:MAG: hypothetical protein KDD55_09530 [Bdellovibrionales bacterium]|nr:hypothetical protein [Bdellovibrionales bacterium]
MCGIFGVVAAKTTKVQSILQAITDALFTLSQSRGKEAAGIAAIVGDLLAIAKEARRPTEFLQGSSYRQIIEDVKNIDTPLHDMLIGHSRLVTNGNQEEYHNNQPVVVDGIVGVHNGIIVNVEELWNEIHSQPTTSVDSEIIFSLLRSEWETKQDIQQATTSVFDKVCGAASIAALWTDLDILLLATNTGSLYYSEPLEGELFVFASEELVLEALYKQAKLQSLFSSSLISQLRPGTGLVVSRKGGERSLFLFESKQRIPGDEFIANIPRQIVYIGQEVSSPSARPFSLSPLSTKLIERSYSQDFAYAGSLQRCCKCVLPETMPFLSFDENGVCNYCQQYKQTELYSLDTLRSEAEKIRSNGSRADCLVGLSGGRDSIYCLHYVKNVLNLNPIAYTYDWGLVTDLARRNCSRICGKLGIEHIIVSADIAKKRRFVRSNVAAWLKKPELGMIPLFMAGDKAYFFHAQRLKSALKLPLVIFGENLLERTDFKSGFAGVPPFNEDADHVYTLPQWSKFRLGAYYLSQYLRNPAYINASLIDSLQAYFFYYGIERDYINLYRFIPWEEDSLVRTIRDEYDFELSDDTDSTWRIGDGTSAFYNFIYYHIVGFTENDTFRSNQIREGVLTREKALELIEIENEPRVEGIRWYLETIGIDADEALSTITALPKMRHTS